MVILDIFYSLQGESTYAGYPCTFVRLHGCNLACHYCDTPESRDPGVTVRRRSVPEVISEIRAHVCPLVEITGGEPLLQPATIPLCDQLVAEGFTVLLETNGSLSLANVPVDVVKIVDVKTPSSRMQESFRLDNLTCLRPPDQLKFVVADAHDFRWACRFLEQHPLSDGVEILFSPVYSRLAPAKLAGWLLDNGIRARLQIQLHKLLRLP
ncbi:MAG: radical SAM protein [Acidobacteria bacterium]|nr:radical SAM protein [Acidobacteriota bacterium]